MLCCSGGIWPGGSPFLLSGGVKFLEAGQRSTDNPLSSPDCPMELGTENWVSLSERRSGMMVLKLKSLCKSQVCRGVAGCNAGPY